MTVTFYHFVFNENIWNESPLGYSWFPLPPSEPVLPPVPPKDTDTNMVPNPPETTDFLPAIDLEIASGEPQPPSARIGHRRQVSSWLPTPRDPEDKARTLAAARLMRGLPADAPLSSTNNFEEIAINQLPGIPAPEIAPRLSLSECISRLSFGGPQWAKKLRATKRGVDLPFPVTSQGTIKRYPIKLNNQRGSKVIEAPVSRASFEETEVSTAGT